MEPILVSSDLFCDFMDDLCLWDLEPNDCNISSGSGVATIDIKASGCYDKTPMNDFQSFFLLNYFYFLIC